MRFESNKQNATATAVGGLRPDPAEKAYSVPPEPMGALVALQGKPGEHGRPKLRHSVHSKMRTGGG